MFLLKGAEKGRNLLKEAPKKQRAVCFIQKTRNALYLYQGMSRKSDCIGFIQWKLQKLEGYWILLGEAKKNSKCVGFYSKKSKCMVSAVRGLQKVERH